MYYKPLVYIIFVHQHLEINHVTVMLPHTTPETVKVDL